MSVQVQEDPLTKRWAGGRIAARARCLVARNPSVLTYVGTNTWIVGEPGSSACAVVDPGPDDVAHLYRIKDICHEGGRRIAAILLTHIHADHSAGAARLAALSGAPVLSRASGTLPDGRVDVPGLDVLMLTVSLPGHSSDSVGFHMPADASVLTGDVIFAQSPTMVCWPDGVLAAYLESLDVLERLVTNRGVRLLLTGHGTPIDQPLDRIVRCREHRFRRLDQVVSAVKSGVPAEADLIVDAVYDDIDPRLRHAAGCSVHAQLRYVLDTGLLPMRRI